MTHWVDGVVDAGLPVDDRAFAYGDGLFETIAVRGGHARLLSRHLARLRRGCERLGLPCDVAVLGPLLAGRAATLGDGVLKFVLSRGSGPRGYAPPPSPRPRQVLFAFPGPRVAPAPAPLRVCLCRTPISVNRALAGIKHLNRLDQVLARSEWDPAAVDEGLMLDDRDRLVCATSANVFVALDGALLTPPIDRAGVRGVMRGLVLDVAAECGVPVQEAELTRAELARAQALLLSSSLLGLRAASRLDDRALALPPACERLCRAVTQRLEQCVE